jgi:hypothetical protein
VETKGSIGDYSSLEKKNIDYMLKEEWNIKYRKEPNFGTSLGMARRVHFLKHHLLHGITIVDKEHM